MSQADWGPRYGDPSHPTTGELPRVGNGRHTDELRTVQVDTVAEPPQPEAPSRYRYSWETEAPMSGDQAAGYGQQSGEWSVPRLGREGSQSRYGGESRPRFGTGGSQPSYGAVSQPRYSTEGSRPNATGSQPHVAPVGIQPRRDDTAQFARVGDGVRGTVGPVSVQVDHVRLDGGLNGDTQLLSTAAFMRPQEAQLPPAEQAPQPEPGTGSMPAMRHQIGPDWTQMPLRLLAAAVVAIAVLGASAATLITIGNWINP
ncbi:MAG TPA: hypothetical protein VHG10_04405 [Glycomyces sp.]|nr:hypothetical protein [Glycomyces sp.]